MLRVVAVTVVCHLSHVSYVVLAGTRQTRTDKTVHFVSWKYRKCWLVDELVGCCKLTNFGSFYLDFTEFPRLNWYVRSTPKVLHCWVIESILRVVAVKVVYHLSHVSNVVLMSSRQTKTDKTVHFVSWKCRKCWLVDGFLLQFKSCFVHQKVTGSRRLVVSNDVLFRLN